MHEVKPIKSIRQLYDENGDAYYPLSASGAIKGDVSSLNLGNIKKVIDLSYCLSLNFLGGTFTVSTINNMFYFYEVDCTYGTIGASIPVDEELIVASNIPDSYRITGAIIPLSASDGMTDSISIYVDENGTMKATVLPLGRTDVSEDKYQSSIKAIKASGFFVKYQANNSNEKDKYKSSVEFFLSSSFVEDTMLTFNLRSDFEYKIESMNENGYVVSADFFEPDNRLTTVTVKIPKQAVMIKISGEFKVINYPNVSNITAIKVGNMSSLTEFTYIDYTTGKQIPSLTEFSMGTNSINNMSAMFYDCTMLVSIPELYTNNANTLYQAFYNCNALVDIPSSLNTDHVDNMKEAFYGCSSLVKAPNMNTTNVTNMSYMFAYNYKLSSVPSYDYKLVQNTSYMFYSCNALTRLGDFNTGKCTNFERMFQNCTSLTNVGTVDLTKAETVYGLIDGCTKITSIKLDSLSLEYDFKPNTKLNAESINYMLDNIQEPRLSDSIIDITGVAGSPEIYTGNWNVLQAIERGWTIIGANAPLMTFGMDRMTSAHTIAFNGASDAPYVVETVNSAGTVLSSVSCEASVLPTTYSLNIPTGTEKIVVRGSMIIFQYPIDITIKTIDVQNMPMLANLSTMGSESGKYDPCRQTTTLTRFTLRQNNITNMSYMFQNCSHLTSIPELYSNNALNMTYMFDGCTGLGSIPMMNTAKVTNMAYMFYRCSSLITIPQLDVSACTNMAYMFHSCTSLTSLPILNAVNAASMDSMFRNCTGLRTIGGINASVKLLNTTTMFYDCRALSSIPMFDMSKTTSATYMFGNCTAITTIPELVMSFVGSAQGMFSGCNLLKNTPPLDLQRASSTRDMFLNCTTLSSIGKLQTGNVIDMQQMFYGCSRLVTIPFMNTSNVTNMASMFNRCTGLISIPSNLDVRKVTNMDSMFAYCSSLNNIPINRAYTGSVTTMNSMFLGCAGITNIDDGMENGRCTNFAAMFKNCSNASGTFTIKNMNSTNVTEIFAGTSKPIVFRYYSTNSAAVSYAAPSNVRKQALA